MTHLPGNGNEEPKLRPIDHPTQEGWLAAGLDILDIPAADEPAPEQFLRFGDDARQIMHAMSVASRRTDSARATHEQANVAKLLLSPDELKRYHELAGRPKESVEYIEWFSEKATNAYAYLSEPTNLATHIQRLNREKLGKIGLELGGRRQVGDWESTKELDKSIRDIPPALHTHTGAAIEVFDDPDDPGLLDYQSIPLYLDGSGSKELEYITARRRRILADIVIGNSLVVELFKESDFLLVLKNLSTKARERLISPYNRDLPDIDAWNSRPARVAAPIVEEGIEQRATTVKVTPIGARHVMMVRGPKSFQESLESLMKKATMSKLFD